MFEPFTLDQLTQFLAVVDEGSFSAAGRRLGRVQSAVSHGVGVLEEAVGLELFDRSGRRPVLTDAGERLASEARLVVGQARTLREVAGSVRSGLEASVSLAVSPMYSEARLVSVCRAFHEQFPGLPLRLRTGRLGEERQLMRAGEVDLAICHVWDRFEEGYAAHPAGTVHLVPVCGAQHPLAREPAPHRPDRLRRFTQLVITELESGDDRGVLAVRTWRLTSVHTKTALLIAGVGWGSAPAEQVAEHLESGRLVRLHPVPWPDGHHLPMHALTRSSRPLGPAGSWLRDRLCEVPEEVSRC